MIPKLAWGFQKEGMVYIPRGYYHYFNTPEGNALFTVGCQYGRCPTRAETPFLSNKQYKVGMRELHRLDLVGES